jgi:hypothetical protein
MNKSNRQMMTSVLLTSRAGVSTKITAQADPWQWGDNAAENFAQQIGIAAAHMHC